MLEDGRGLEFRAQLSARLARVGRKRCDIDEPLHTLVRSRGCNHNATPRVANENDRAVAGAIEGALNRQHIILQRGQRVLNRNGVEPLSVETSNDLAPAGTVSPE